MRRGTLCSNPIWLMDLYVRDPADTGNRFIERVGSLTNHGMTSDHLDYFIHRELGVPLSQADEVHTKRQIFIVLHAKREKVWKEPDKGWNTAVAYKSHGKWSIIPIA
jgi:hypothetical protein